MVPAKSTALGEIDMSSESRAASGEQTEPLDLWLFERKAWGEGYRYVAGVDEAGRGPLAGPVVAAAVILPTDFDLDRIADSKTLTARQRDTSYERIISSAVAVGVGIIEPETIDRINILQATFEAMWAALIDMRALHNFVLIDGDKIIPRLLVDQRAIVGGDGKSASIAAASIVAKVTRDRIMIELADEFPQYGFEKHKGYGTPEHLCAIDEHGVCRVHRRSFAPVARKAGDGWLQKGLF